MIRTVESSMSNVKRILTSSCGTACVEVETGPNSGIVVDADGEKYICFDPENRPNAWSRGTETWFMAAGAVSIAPWCGKCGARYKVLVHDEFWPGCTCGAPITDEQPTIDVFQLEEVRYKDQHGFPRVEKRKREVRNLKRIGIETHNSFLVYVAVDDGDRVYTKAVGGGLGWTTNDGWWSERCARRLIP